MAYTLLRFRDLKSRGIVNNHMTLKRWIEREGFPTGFMIGPNSRAWHESAVLAWLASRPIENKLMRGIAKRDRDELDVRRDEPDAV